MHAASRHGTSSLTSLPKDGGVSCFGHSSGRSPIQFFDSTRPCLTSVKLMEQAGPLGHSPQRHLPLKAEFYVKLHSPYEYLPRYFDPFLNSLFPLQ